MSGEHFDGLLLAPSYSTLQGVSGVAAVPAGAIVTGISAFASLAGATIQVGGGGANPVPQGGATELEPAWWVDPQTGQLRGALVGAVNITFTNTDGYIVELVQ
jgi:hypothetical protein